MLLAALGALAGCGGAFADGAEPLQGVVELEERALGFEVAGRLRERPVERGAVVAAGQVLAILDDGLARPVRDARAAEARAAQARAELLRVGARTEDVLATAAELRAARATVTLLERDLAREQELVARAAGAPERVQQLADQLARARAQAEGQAARLRALERGARAQEVAAAEATAAAATAALAAEEERLARFVLRAPIAGVVLETHAWPGEVVAAGAPVVTLGEPRRPYVDVFVPEGRVAGVRPGQRAAVRVDGEPAAFPGRVEDVGRRTEFTPRFLFSERERPLLVLRVRVRIDDAAERLRAGVPAFVTLEPPTTAAAAPARP